MKTINKKKGKLVFMTKIALSLLLVFSIHNCSKDVLYENQDLKTEKNPAQIQSKAFITIQNAGFESGKDNWGNESNFAISSDEYSGSQAAKVNSSTGKIEQTVNVSTNTNYELKAWVDGNGKLSVGGSTNDFNTSSYSQITVSFNSGSSTSVTLLGTRDSGDVRFDDFTLESGSSGPVTFTPERHQELVGETFRLENVGSQLWARITATGDFKDLEMTPQTSTGNWPRWVVEEVNDGGDYYYRFKNVATNRRFRPRSTSDSRVYTGKTSWIGNWTQWMVISQDNNYILVNKSTGTILSAGGNSNGSIVQHVDNLDGDNTLWSFECVDCSNPPPPPTGDTPYDVLGLDDWKITLPRSNDGDNISDEVYITSSKNDVPSDGSLTDYEDEFFYTSNDGVIFECPAIYSLPKTSAGTSNTRTELREMPNNDNEGGWSASGSTVRELEFSARVLQTSSTEKVAFAQIHDYQQSNWDDLIRIQIESDSPNATEGDYGKIYIMGDMAEGLSSEGVPTQPSSERTIIENYRLGDWMDIRVTFNNNTIRIYLNGVEVQEYTGADCSSNYFKAGAYNQSMNSSSSGKSVVEFRSLTVTENF